MNKVKCVFSFLSVLFLSLCLSSCSSLFHNSTGGKITFALNLSEIYGSRNASIENNINEIQQDSLTISLFDIDDSLIDSKTVIFNYPNETIISLAFEAIPIGKKIYATAKLIFNNKKYSYDGKDNPLIIKDGTNVLPIDLELNIFNSLYLLFSEISYNFNIPYYNIEMTDDLNSISDEPEFENVLDFTIGGEDCFYYATVDLDIVKVIKSNDTENPRDTGVSHEYNYKLYYDYENDFLHSIYPNQILNLNNNDSVNPIDFAVYNETYYLAFNKIDASGSQSNEIYLGAFSESGNSYNCEESIELSSDKFAPENVSSITDVSIKDMIIINGELYVLWSYYGTSLTDNYIKSYGGVLVVDINTFSVENLLSNFYSTIDFEVLDNYNERKACKFYGPTSIDDTNYLFGPSKVVAIKPKKLVVADEGIFVFKDNDGILKYKNVNRVVEIDLINPSNITQAVTDATFYKDKTDPIQVGSEYPNVTLAAE